MIPLPRVDVPIAGAPMAGGPSTPELAAAVSSAGGLGFVAGGGLSPSGLADELARARALTDRPIGVNLFAPILSRPAGARAAASAYAALLAPEAERCGVILGWPFDDQDDGFAAKVNVVLAARPALVSFAFGVPTSESVARLHDAGIPLAFTVNDLEQAGCALLQGADVLVAQGFEAGGHRGGPVDDAAEIGALDLLGQVRDLGLPVIAAGGFGSASLVAAALDGGAAMVSAGTAFLRADEAGTSPAHRAALGGPTVLTRAFTGRFARSVCNRFSERYSAVAPLAYPDVHQVTAPLRAEARRRRDAQWMHLWSGTRGHLAVAAPAAQILHSLAGDGR